MIRNGRLWLIVIELHFQWHHNFDVGAVRYFFIIGLRMSNLEKLEWIHWVLDEISQGHDMTDEIEKAIAFVEDIRELFIPDMK